MNPSKSQLKALQQLRTGATLVYRSWPSTSVHLEAPGNSAQWMLIHVSTAKIIVSMAWVEMISLKPKFATYRLSAAGRKLTEAFCECKHERDETMETMDDRLVCRRCWLVLPCQGERHPAHFWLWGTGAICEGHARRMAG